jgi:hypothetical protein
MFTPFETQRRDDTRYWFEGVRNSIGTRELQRRARDLLKVARTHPSNRRAQRSQHRCKDNF